MNGRTIRAVWWETITYGSVRISRGSSPGLLDKNWNFFELVWVWR
jgi:hypothetical protein